MNKLNISKVLDILSMIAIVAVFAVYIFKKPPFEIIAMCLILIAVLKMGASMLKASYFSAEYFELEKENDILKEKISYLENEINKNNSK